MYKTCSICGVERVPELSSGDLCVICDWQIDKGHSVGEIKEMIQKQKEQMHKMVFKLVPISVTPEELTKARYRLMDKYIQEFGNDIPDGKVVVLSMPRVSDTHYNLIFEEEDIKYGRDS